MEYWLLAFSSFTILTALLRGTTVAKIISSYEYPHQVLPTIKAANVFINDIVSACKNSQY